jgi:hypothetical protein
MQVFRMQDGIWLHDVMVARFQDAGWNMVGMMYWLQDEIWLHDVMVARFQDAGWNIVARCNGCKVSGCRIEFGCMMYWLQGFRMKDGIRLHDVMVAGFQKRWNMVA